MAKKRMFSLAVADTDYFLYKPFFQKVGGIDGGKEKTNTAISVL